MIHGHGFKGMSWALSVAVIVPQLGLALVIPALPRIILDSGGAQGTADVVMTPYFVGYAISMLVSGVLADRYGARRVQMWGLGLFVVSSVLCAVAASSSLIASGRFLQGLGGASGTVLTRLVAQQRYPESRRMQILTTLSLAITLTPCLAPVAGGWLTEHAHWSVLFLVMAAAGTFSAVLFSAAVPADPPPPRAERLNIAEVARDYLANLRVPAYCGYAAAISLVSMSQVVFVSHSAHSLESAMGVSPATCGTLLATAALGSVCGTTAVRLVSRSYGNELLLRLASIGCFAGGLVMVAATLAAPAAPWGAVGPMIIVMAGVGATVPLCQAGLMNTSTVNSGNAAGLFFFLQLSTATLYSAVVGRWSCQSSHLLAVTIAVPCTVLVLGVWIGHRLILRKPNLPEHVAPIPSVND
jgi:MFS transporter, DHA1 family, multidrug resistance protein